jgi:hypothetical protein
VVSRNPGPNPEKPIYELRNEDEEEEELWAVEKWKSKSRIPTFPPPRMPAALGKNRPFTQNA